MKRPMTFLLGLAAYAIGMASFIPFAAFLIGYPASFGIDAPRTRPLVVAIAVNLLLLLLFAVQHSVMARPAFKRWWTRFIPPEIERSVYVAASAVALTILVFAWQPLGGIVWDVQNQQLRIVLYGLYALGWGTVVYSTFLINHFDLFGLRQVYLKLRERPYTSLPFKIPALYKLVRHPLYVGWFTVFWATPTMSVSHLFLALGLSAYVLGAVRFEERDLLEAHGDNYREYQQRVPRFFPKLVRRSPAVKKLTAGESAAAV